MKRWRLLIDVLGFVGAFLLVVGVLWLQMQPEQNPGGRALTYAGSGLFAFYLVLLVVRFLGDPNLKEYLQLFLYSLMVLGILGAVNYIVFRHDLEWDVTQEKIHSLTPETRQILKDLDRDIRLTAFITEGNPQRERLEILMKRYAKFSPNIQYAIYDPIRDPLKAQAYDLDTTSPTIFVEEAREGGRRIRADSADEEGITNAILRLLQPPRKVCFTSAHGERNPEEFGDTGFSEIADVLARKNYTVKRIRLLEERELGDCEILFIASPRNPFTESERRIVEEYLAQEGARLLIFVDPLDPYRAAAPSINSLLAPYGVEVDAERFVVDVANRISEEPYAFAIAGAGYSTKSPITKDLGNLGVVVFLAAPLRLSDEAPEGIEREVILQSGSRSWAQKLREVAKPVLEEGDYFGPVPIGVQIEDREKDVRILVIGDSDFAMNAIVRSLPNNRDLLVRMVRWLAREEKLVEVTKPERKDSEVLTLTRAQQVLLLLLVVTVIPGIFGILGLIFWSARRAL